MDKKVLIAWIVGLILRGIAWVFAAKLGMDAVESETLAMQAAQGIGAILLVALTTYSSIKGRKVLADQEPAPK